MGKSAKGVPRYYLDANVFLSLIEETPGRVRAIKAILDECEQGDCEVFTSHLSIAECAFAKAEKDGRALEPEVEAKIDELWHPDFPMQIVEVHQLVVYDAKNLIRESMKAGWANRETWSLKPADAIHLVTAKRHNVDAFLTYDKPLRKYGPVVGYPVREPREPAHLLFDPPEPAWRPRVQPHWLCYRPKPVHQMTSRYIPHMRRCLLAVSKLASPEHVPQPHRLDPGVSQSRTKDVRP